MAYEQDNIHDYIAALFGISGALLIWLFYYCRIWKHERLLAKLAAKRIKKGDNDQVIGILHIHTHTHTHKAYLQISTECQRAKQCKRWTN
jgi:hypothetical protein